MYWATNGAMKSFSASDFLSVCANASDSSVTSELWLVQDRTSGLVTAVFLLLFLVIGLPWNLLVVVTIVKQKLYTQPTIILLLSLVLTDLILLVFHLPFATIVGFHGEYLFGSSDQVRCLVCDKTGFISLLFSLNSIFTISLMSADRFLFIYKPFQYIHYVTKWRTVVAIVVAWLIATVVAILPLVRFGNITYSDVTLACGLEVSFASSHYPIFVLVVSSLPMIPVIVCNMWVCCIVQRNIQAIYKVKRSLKLSTPDDCKFYRNMKKKRREKETHLFKVFGVLLLSNAITWLPTLVTILLFFSGTAVPASFISTAHVLFLSQTVLHPIIETTLIKEVRVPLKNILFCCCIVVRAKVFPDKRACCFETGRQKSGKHSDDLQGTTSSNHCGFIDVCTAALLFEPSQSSVNDTEAPSENIG